MSLQLKKPGVAKRRVKTWLIDKRTAVECEPELFDGVKINSAVLSGRFFSRRSVSYRYTSLYLVRRDTDARETLGGESIHLYCRMPI